MIYFFRWFGYKSVAYKLIKETSLIIKVSRPNAKFW